MPRLRSFIREERFSNALLRNLEILTPSTPATPLLRATLERTAKQIEGDPPVSE